MTSSSGGFATRHAPRLGQGAASGRAVRKLTRIGRPAILAPTLDTVSLCPFTVGSVIWQPQTGAWTLTACVKGTFHLEHGRDATLASEQDPIADDRYFADSASLYAPSDLAPFKPRADVTLVGHAYAPDGRPIEALVAGLSIGDLSKSVGLIGDRAWVEGADGLEPSSPAPFVRMPLRYERAARGADNAVGLDLAAPPVAGALALPNLEAMEDDFARGQTVGFGPIAPTWPSRRNVLHEAALGWILDRRGPVPADFDFGYFNAAPRDQQVDLLRGNAKLVLENLHPRHARLETRIPAVRPKAFFVDGKSGRANEIALRCDTIWIDTDRGLLVLVWRGLTGIETGDEKDLGTLVVAIETKGKEIRYKQVENLLRDGALASLGTDDLATEERNPMSVRHDSVKPGGPAPPKLPARAPSDHLIHRPSRDGDRRTSPPSESAPRNPPRPPPPPATPPPPPPAPPHRPVLDSSVTATEVAVSPFEPSDGPQSVETPADVDENELVDVSTTGTTGTDVAPPGSTPPTPEPSAEAKARAAEPAPRRAPTWRDVSGHEAPDSPRVDEVGLAIERYAEVSAELAQPDARQAEVLSAYELTEPEWERLDRHWTEAMETAGPDAAVSVAYRAAFSAFQARLRRLPDVKLADYARLAKCAEPGDLERELLAHALDARDLQLLERFWARRAATDPESAAALAEAMEAASSEKPSARSQNEP